MSEKKKNSTVGLQIDAPSPSPEKFNYGVELANLPKWVAKRSLSVESSINFYLFDKCLMKF